MRTASGPKLETEPIRVVYIVCAFDRVRTFDGERCVADGRVYANV
jgi:hypothetical protein